MPRWTVEGVSMQLRRQGGYQTWNVDCVLWVEHTKAPSWYSFIGFRSVL